MNANEIAHEFSLLHKNDKVLITGRILSSYQNLSAGLRLLKQKEAQANKISLKILKMTEKLSLKDGEVHKWDGEEKKISDESHLLSSEVHFLYEALIVMMGNFTEKLGSLMHQKLNSAPPSIKKLSEFNANIKDYTQKNSYINFSSEGIDLAKKLHKDFYKKQRNAVSHEDELSVFTGITTGGSGSTYEMSGEFRTSIEKLEENLIDIVRWTGYVASFINANE